MILCLADTLSPALALQWLDRLRAAAFEDGARSAGWAAQAVKHNEQLPADSALRRQVQAVVESALQASPTFVSAALPRAMSSVIVSRTRSGGGYGPHVDNALMGSPPLRTDLAYTLFLSPPEAYEGGELVLDEPQGEQSFKLPAGQLVLYPATTLHRVNTVSRGERCVVAGWVQSLVPDPRVREMLFELDQARRELFGRDGASRTFAQVNRTYSNLLRLHASP